MDVEKRDLAERWILGELMDYAELQLLGVESNLKEGGHIFAMMQIIIEAMDEVIVLFFDELEKPFHGDDLALDVPNAQEHAGNIFTVILRLVQETTNMLVILSTNTPDWPNVKEHIPPELMEMLSPPFDLHVFTFPEFKQLCEAIFAKFWQEKQINLVSDPFYPLNEKILETLFTRSNANPRECLRLLKKSFSAIAFEEWDENEIQEKALEQF